MGIVADVARLRPTRVFDRLVRRATCLPPRSAVPDASWGFPLTIERSSRTRRRAPPGRHAAHQRFLFVLEIPPILEPLERILDILGKILLLAKAKSFPKFTRKSRRKSLPRPANLGKSAEELEMHFRLIDVYEAARAEIACGSVAAGKHLSVQNRSLVGCPCAMEKSSVGLFDHHDDIKMKHHTPPTTQNRQKRILQTHTSHSPPHARTRRTPRPRPTNSTPNHPVHNTSAHSPSPQDTARA